MTQKFYTQNPSDESVISEYNYLSFEQVSAQIQAAQVSFEIWRKTSLQDRRKSLVQLALNLRSYKQQLAELMSLEMGKHLSESYAEIDKSIHCCEFYADNGESFLAPQKIEMSYRSAQVFFEPLGLVYSIMPWNYPLWQVVRFAAPTLMAGNVILLKHSDLTAGSAELIVKIFKNIFEVDLLFNIHSDHSVAAQVIADPRVRAVTFTGSTAGGRKVAELCGRYLKKCVLELGGSDAYIVLADADLDLAARVCAQARMTNSGQSCVSAKRFVVVRSVVKSFLEKLKQHLDKVQVAPLAHKKFQIHLQEQVEKLIHSGGKVVYGKLADIKQKGSYFPALVLQFEKNIEELKSEELFGPVCVVIEAADQAEALQIANSTVYGLGGAVFSQNTYVAHQLATKEIQAGFVSVNEQVKSDPRLPFGGIKDSGFGRELGVFGIREFVNVKTVIEA